jgi:hypothetical protein
LNELFPNDKEFADQNIWHKFHSIVFGFKNTQGKLRTFESTLIKNHQAKTIEQNDPAAELIDKLKAALKKATEENNSAAVAKLTPLVGMGKAMYNIDNNQHLNVMTLDGTVGQLKIRHKSMIALNREIKALEALGIDPLSVDNGRCFVMSKVGRGSDTSFPVTVYESVETDSQGRKIKVEFVHKLTPDLIARVKADATNLYNVANVITVDEVKQIVDSVDLMTGKSPACDLIFDARWKAEREAKQPGRSASAPVARSRATEETPAQEPSNDYAPPAAPQSPLKALETNVAKETKRALETPAAKPTIDLMEVSENDFFGSIGLDLNSLKG